MTDKYKATLWLNQKNVKRLKRRAITEERSISVIIDELIEKYLENKN